MTTYTHPDETQSTSPALLLLLPLAVIMVLMYLFFVVLAAPPPPVHAPVVTDPNTARHTQKHVEAEAIRSCLDQHGAAQVWRSRSWREPNKFFRVCQLDDGRLGVMVVKWSARAGVWREVTSFVIKDGRASQTREYLSGISRLVYGPGG